MTVQFPRQAITTLSASLPTRGSGLVSRLVQARDDPGKERIRIWLIDRDDSQLQSGLGPTLENIVVCAVICCEIRVALMFSNNLSGRTNCNCANVHFGSGADILHGRTAVRLTPQNGHGLCDQLLKIPLV